MAGFSSYMRLPHLLAETLLNTAQIILLLLSANFLASEHCHDVMMRALQKHKEDNVYVIPILLRPVNWEDSPVSALQAFPANGKPVTNWRNRGCHPESCVMMGSRPNRSLR